MCLADGKSSDERITGLVCMFTCFPQTHRVVGEVCNSVTQTCEHILNLLSPRMLHRVPELPPHCEIDLPG